MNSVSIYRGFSNEFANPECGSHWMQPDKSPDVLYRSRKAVDASSELAQFIGGYLISLSHGVFANLMRIIIVLKAALDPTDKGSPITAKGELDPGGAPGYVKVEFMGGSSCKKRCQCHAEGAWDSHRSFLGVRTRRWKSVVFP